MIDKPLPPPKCFQNPVSSPVRTSAHRSSIPRTVSNVEMQAYTSLQVDFNHHHRRNRIKMTYHFSNSEPGPESRRAYQHWSQRGGGGVITIELTCMPNMLFWPSSLRGTRQHIYADACRDVVWCEGAGPGHATTTAIKNRWQKSPPPPHHFSHESSRSRSVLRPVPFWHQAALRRVEPAISHLPSDSVQWCSVALLPLS